MIELLFFLLGLIIGLLSGITFICLYFVKSVSGNSILELPSIKNEKKTIKKNFWFSYDEDKQLKYLSSILNLSESNTIRKLLYETQVKECPPKEFYEAIDKINKIGININQLAKIANSTGIIYEDKLNQQFNELEKLKNSIYEKYI